MSRQPRDCPGASNAVHGDVLRKSAFVSVPSVSNHTATVSAPFCTALVSEKLVGVWSVLGTVPEPGPITKKPSAGIDWPVVCVSRAPPSGGGPRASQPPGWTA